MPQILHCGNASAKSRRGVPLWRRVLARAGPLNCCAAPQSQLPTRKQLQAARFAAANNTNA
jgi:hypothetical protein